jgi:hypothetical protein
VRDFMIRYSLNYYLIEICIQFFHRLDLRIRQTQFVFIMHHMLKRTLAMASVRTFFMTVRFSIATHGTMFTFPMARLSM